MRTERHLGRKLFVTGRSEVAVLLALVLVLTACAGASPRMEDRPTTPTPSPACAANAGALGVTAVSAVESAASAERQSTQIAAAGFGTVRLGIEWPVVERVEGVLDWASTDRLVKSFSSRGLRVLGVITWTPSWGKAPTNVPALHSRPADAARFAAFVRIAAARYQPYIATWEVWNEPNVKAAFAPGADARLYVEMLKLSYEAIKAIDPRATVLSGGTSPSGDGPTDLSPASFVRALYGNGAKPYFDGIAMHPYSVPELLSEGGGHPGSSMTAISDVRAEMFRNGDSSKRIWFTEFGAATSSMAQGVSDARQAEILVDGITYMRSLPFCGAIVIFDYRDVQTGGPVAELSAGLVRSDYSPKPSLQAVLRLK